MQEIAKDVIEIEPAVDISETLALLKKSFGTKYPHNAEYLEWLYSHSGDSSAVVVRLAVGARKVGQIVFIPHHMRFNGKLLQFGLIVDFFILPEFRNGPRVIRFLKAALAASENAGFDNIYGVPNNNSLPLVKRFLKGVPVKRLAIRLGLAFPTQHHSVITSRYTKEIPDSVMEQLIAPYLLSTDNARAWDAKGLVRRLRDPSIDFAIHMTDKVLLISCRRIQKYLPLTLLCGYFSKDNLNISISESDKLIRSACRLHRQIVFCYIGDNKYLRKLPGLPIPERMRHNSPMSVLMRPKGEESPVPPDRYEILDFDIV